MLGSVAPYLDIAGFTARTEMPASDVAIVTTNQPGWFAAKEAQVRATLNSRLRKRYAVPFGANAPPLYATGTMPPPAILSGTPTLGSMAIVLTIVAAGALGTASFQWSDDGGSTWTSAATLASSGTSPPAVTVSGESSLAVPGLLSVRVTAGGTLGAALFQWSEDGGQTWNLNPVLAATGTTPPAATISGVSSLAIPADLQIQITGAGVLGTAAFRWSLNGGSTWSSGVTASSVPLPGTGLTVTFPAGTYATDNVYVGQGIATASSVPLPGTGLTVTFPAGTYATDNVYEAPTPVPETALAWMTAILTPAMYRKRGVSPDDPQLKIVEDDRTRAFDEIKEAADSETGLFELPLNEASGVSAVTRSVPLAYTENSPYVSADIQESIGRTEDGWYR